MLERWKNNKHCRKEFNKRNNKSLNIMFIKKLYDHPFIDLSHMHCLIECSEIICRKYDNLRFFVKCGLIYRIIPTPNFKDGLSIDFFARVETSF